MASQEGCSRSGGRPYALVWSPIPLISWLVPFIGHIGVCSSSGVTYDFAGPYTVNEDALLFGRPTRYVTVSLPNTAAAAGAAAKGSTAVSGFAAPAPAAETDVEAAAAGVGGANIAAATASITVAVEAGARRHEAGRGSSEAVPSQAADYWDHRLAAAAAFYRLMRYDLMTSNCHCFVAHFLNRIAFRGGSWDMVNLAVFMFVHGRYTSPAGLLYTWLPWVALVALGGYFGRVWFLAAYLLVCAPLLAWFLLYTKCCWRDLSP